MRLLDRRSLVLRRTEQPDQDKEKPATDGGDDACHPGPRRRDEVRPSPLVVGHVADGDGELLFNVSEEGALVVDHEVEDAVLVWRGEVSAIYRELSRGSGGVLLQLEAMEGRQHAEFKLEVVSFGNDEGSPVIPLPLGD